MSNILSTNKIKSPFETTPEQEAQRIKEKHRKARAEIVTTNKTQPATFETSGKIVGVDPETIITTENLDPKIWKKYKEAAKKRRSSTDEKKSSKKKSSSKRRTASKKFSDTKKTEEKKDAPARSENVEQKKKT